MTACILVKQYATTRVYEQALHPTDHKVLAYNILLGSPWTASRPEHETGAKDMDVKTDEHSESNTNSNMAMNVDLDDNLSSLLLEPNDTEEPDTTLANIILFM